MLVSGTSLCIICEQSWASLDVSLLRGLNIDTSAWELLCTPLQMSLPEQLKPELCWTWRNFISNGAGLAFWCGWSSHSWECEVVFRSPAVVIAYLMRLKGWQLLQSYQWVKDRRPSIKLTPGLSHTFLSTFYKLPLWFMGNPNQVSAVFMWSLKSSWSRTWMQMTVLVFVD